MACGFCLFAVFVCIFAYRANVILLLGLFHDYACVCVNMRICVNLLFALYIYICVFCLVDFYLPAIGNCNFICCQLGIYLFASTCSCACMYAMSACRACFIWKIISLWLLGLAACTYMRPAR